MMEWKNIALITLLSFVYLLVDIRIVPIAIAPLIIYLLFYEKLQKSVIINKIVIPSLVILPLTYILVSTLMSYKLLEEDFLFVNNGIIIALFFSNIIFLANFIIYYLYK